MLFFFRSLSRRVCIVLGACSLVILFAGGVYVLASPPPDFTSKNLVIIADGTPAADIAKDLADAHIVTQHIVLELLLRISGVAGGVQAGSYRFETPENVFTVARRLVTGAYGFPPIRMTFVEGTTARDMAAQIADTFSSVPAEEFLEIGKPYEGYLFPDTYLFSPSDDARSIVKAMRPNFYVKIAPLDNDIAASGHSLADIVTMASLIEREARTPVARQMVAGILWNRLALGMPLQVDAVFGYIFDRNTYSPSFADLKVDSPYNTYTHKGLPPGPICNPGLDALDAALHPIESDYLYYLTDKNGVMHYAKTYASHQSNQ